MQETSPERLYDGNNVMDGKRRGVLGQSIWGWWEMERAECQKSISARGAHRFIPTDFRRHVVPHLNRYDIQVSRCRRVIPESMPARRDTGASYKSAAAHCVHKNDQIIEGKGSRIFP